MHFNGRLRFDHYSAGSAQEAAQMMIEDLLEDSRRGKEPYTFIIEDESGNQEEVTVFPEREL